MVTAPIVHYVTAKDGYKIAYTVEGFGLPYVAMPFAFHDVLHGRALRLPAITSIAARFQVILYDHRGQGMSSRGLAPDHNWSDLQWDLEAVVDGLGLESFVLSAPGRQASIAIQYAASHPGRVSALLLYYPDLGEEDQATKRPNLREMAQQNWEFFLEVVARTSMFHEDPYEARNLLRQSMSQADYLRLHHGFQRDSVEGLLAQIHVPTLIVSTKAGIYAYTSTATANRLAGAIPGASLVEISDAATEFVPALEAFIDRLSGEGISALGRPGSPVSLSNRETEVLRLVAAGRSNYQIAEALVISPSTVAKHLTGTFRKIGAANRTEAAAFAHQHGLA
jgi:DNA-binding NarL/FixJ family response regulator